MSRPRLLVIAIAASCSLAFASPAWGHAQLLGTSPTSGATVPAQPREVIFEFNQNVGGTLGAVRVYDARGDEVDDLDVSHPDGDEHWMGVGLKPHLPDGTYTATYRVISADTHIVYGGLVFSIGHPGAAPRFTVAGLIGRNEAGEVTKLAVGVVRFLDYLTLALMIGGLAFLHVAWLPGLLAACGAEPRWVGASRAFATRLERLLLFAVLLGLLVSVLGVLLQGASAAGVSLWSSLKGSILESTLESRFGVVWGLRALVWLAIGLAMALARALGAGVVPALETRGGEAGAPSPRRAPPVLSALLVLGCAYLAVTPALAGHASIESPTGVFFPSDILHVLAASVWVGGIACLLIALPAATRRLEASERSRLLLATLARFSPLALASVIAIAATGAIQAYIDVRTLQGLLHTTYGALIIAKTVLLLALIGLGWVNRRRVIPLLERLVGERRPPGATGVLARRTMRGELALMLCVFALTAALIGYAPPIDAASGPFSTNTTIGPAELEMTVEPARVGLNTVHIYLIDAKTGAQYTATREFTATARLPAKDIGPLPLKATLAGPGHYVLNAAVLSPGGTWEIEIVDRVSEFEESTQVVKVPIR
ncbi:MAG TPA: CopD family protein [Solirubrobacteraceae bacterium]|nr:CopD family protein [Solirubrobacteraceae bacterium]